MLWCKTILWILNIMPQLVPSKNSLIKLILFTFAIFRNRNNFSYKICLILEYCRCVVFTRSFHIMNRVNHYISNWKFCALRSIAQNVCLNITTRTIGVIVYLNDGICIRWPVVNQGKSGKRHEGSVGTVSQSFFTWGNVQWGFISGVFPGLRINSQC